MSIPPTLGLSLLLLFRARQATEEHPEVPLVKHWGLEQENTTNMQRSYRGILEEGLTCRVRVILAHDMHVVRCDLVSESNASFAQAWERLTRHGDALLNVYTTSNPTVPWAVTRLYHTVLPVGVFPEAIPDGFAGLVSTDQSQAKPVLEATPYGWLGLLTEGERTLTSSTIINWERRLLLFIPAERAEKVTHYFLDPLMQGWSRIERHLHKALHHARLQQQISQSLGQAVLSLREQMTAAISTMDFAHLYRESQELEQVSVSLMNFLNHKAQAEMVLHSLRINLHDFVLSLDEVKLSTPLYEREKQRLTRHIEQLQSDLEYARVATESTYAFQEMQRGIENNRLQRASLMLTTASALLAGIAIFNNFLDIWALILDGSNWHLPPMGIRMALGALAGISLPLTAYMLIERRYKPLLLWSSLSVLSVLLAVLSTLWVNQ